MRTIFGVAGGILAFISFFPYISSILRGETKPNRATFAIWSGVNIVTVASYIASGARTTIFVGLVYALFQIFIFGLSFKYGMDGYKSLDIGCLIGAITGAILWIATKNPVLALYSVIVAEIFGLVPTLKKSYLYPQTESTMSWTIAAVGSMINLFALTSLKPQIAVYPIYLFLADASVALLLLSANTRLQKHSPIRRTSDEP
jgi:hypothetical protein